MKRRQFIKKAIEKTAYIGMGIAAIFFGGRTGLPHLDPDDIPPMPKVKPPKKDEQKFGTTSMELDGKGKWHHFVADIPWHRPSKIYIDGKKCTSVAFNGRTEYLSFSILKTSEGFFETFWFRNT